MSTTGAVQIPVNREVEIHPSIIDSLEVLLKGGVFAAQANPEEKSESKTADTGGVPARQPDVSLQAVVVLTNSALLPVLDVTPNSDEALGTAGPTVAATGGDEQDPNANAAVISAAMAFVKPGYRSYTAEEPQAFGISAMDSGRLLKILSMWQQVSPPLLSFAQSSI